MTSENLKEHDRQEPSCSTEKPSQVEPLYKDEESGKHLLPQISKGTNYDFETIKNSVKFVEDNIPTTPIVYKKLKLLKESEEPFRHPIFLKNKYLIKQAERKKLMSQKMTTEKENDFINFMTFLGLKDKLKENKNNKKTEEVDKNEEIMVTRYLRSAPDPENVPKSKLFGSRMFSQRATWMKIKTIHYEKNIIMRGAKMNISWDVQEEITAETYFKQLKQEKAEKKMYIPHEELIENDIERRSVREKVCSEITELEQLYEVTTPISSSLQIKDEQLIVEDSQDKVLEIKDKYEKPKDTIEEPVEMGKINIFTKEEKIDEHQKEEKTEEQQTKEKLEDPQQEENKIVPSSSKEIIKSLRSSKYQKQNWILDIFPHLETEEPWKNMEDEGSYFSQKVIPHSLNETNDYNEITKKQATSEPTHETKLDIRIRKKEKLQEYLTKQEENIYDNLRKNVDANIVMLKRNLLDDGRETGRNRQYEKDRVNCCKCNKKNHKCKRLPKKIEKNENSDSDRSDSSSMGFARDIFFYAGLELFKNMSGTLKYNKLQQKHTENDKPLHPYFGRNTVLAKSFIQPAEREFSSIHRETIKELKAQSLISSHRYYKLTKKDKQLCKERSNYPITIHPLKKGTSNRNFKPSDILTDELLAELNWTVKEEEYVEEQDDGA